MLRQRRSSEPGPNFRSTAQHSAAQHGTARHGIAQRVERAGLAMKAGRRGRTRLSGCLAPLPEGCDTQSKQLPEATRRPKPSGSPDTRHSRSLSLRGLGSLSGRRGLLDPTGQPPPPPSGICQIQIV
eukprot:GHVR01175884.1.p2 GENE.GHVR01175884.1~~GHVR01175884.1.p2  ORF type:complete len:127 (+),score=18.09 GHVR01175884.1:181-561(+)